MKKCLKRFTSLVLVLGLLSPVVAYAREGDCGYEGGISSGDIVGKTKYEYQEVSFLSGEPVVFKGDLTLTKSLKSDMVVSTYKYSLKNLDRAATLTRTIALSTKLVKKDNGQTVEETSVSGTPSESIKVGNTTYTLKNYNFTRSNLVDAKPAVNYLAGNFQGKKTYQVGTTATGGTVTVSATGNFYGFDQYWGTSQVQTINYIIESEQKVGNEVERWGGTASINLSSTITKQIRYVENEPESISFDGGYVQTQYNESILEYTSRLPEMDSKGKATDNLVTKMGSLKLESFPNQLRLPVANLNHLRGHWAENDIKVMYGLEVFKGGEASFNPEQYMTRGEFAAAIVQAAREVPPDPALASKTTTSRTSSTKKQAQTSSFNDVSTESIYYNQIENAFKRGLLNGKGDGNFGKDELLTFSEAIAVFIRAAGLENLAPGDGAVTTFKDNDSIPDYARKAVYVAEKIGMVTGDDRGYLKPNEKLTKGRAAALLNRFVTYMRDGIKRDYKQHIVNY